MDSLTHSNPGGYCDRCYELFSTIEAVMALVSPEGYQHYTGAEAKASAAKGCRLCQELLIKWPERISSDEDKLVCWASYNGVRCQTNPRPIPTELKVSYPYIFDGLICFRLGAGEHSHQRWTKMFTLFAHSDDIAASWLPRRPAVTDVGSESALRIARQSFKTCRDSHTSCPIPKTPQLPTRVIDVGIISDEDRVKLYIASPKERQDYAALSYCWGGPQPILLTTQNLLQLTGSIPFDSLPQTIKDAIKVTRELGIQFLWVDALCIIQEGDDADKLREISVMGQLYKNATITIFAASARSVSEGFLQSRPVPESFSLPLACPDGRQGTVQVTLEATHNFMYPLNTRGWTLQESLLSPRKVIYGEKEQLWDCEMKQEFPTSLFDPAYSIIHLPEAIFVLDRRINSPEAHEIWVSVVGELTGRSLSFPEDRLAAVTGVITELQPVFQDECIFGLWRGNFLKQLCWIRAGPPSSASDALKEKEILRCAPEWSWASRQFQTYFLQLEIYDEQCWELRDNMVVLNRKLIRGHDIPAGQRDRAMEGAGGKFQLDEQEPAGTTLYPSFLLDHEGKEVFYLLLGGRSDPDGVHEFAMAVVPAEDKGKFHRLGFVYNADESWFDNVEKSEILLL